MHLVIQACAVGQVDARQRSLAVLHQGTDSEVAQLHFNQRLVVEHLSLAVVMQWTAGLRWKAMHPYRPATKPYKES